MIRKLLLCRLLGVHRPPDGVDAKWSLLFCCATCGARVVGELGRAMERRR